MTSEELAWRIRVNAIKMVHRARASHIGGVLSSADLVAVLYNDIANIDPDNPDMPSRDRIVLSKGHNGVVVYAALAELGFFDLSILDTYGQNGTILSCHVSHKNVPGVEVSTGSLGHGVCIACGMALNAKIRNKAYHTYAIVGDGECNEGAVWETALLAAHQKLNNFTVIVDRNGMQAMGDCDQIIDMNPLSEKWKAFGWFVVEVKNGHDYEQLKHAFHEKNKNQPRVIIANTIKGKGVSFMENELLWHYRDPQGEFYNQAMSELMGDK